MSYYIRPMNPDNYLDFFIKASQEGVEPLIASGAIDEDEKIVVSNRIEDLTPGGKPLDNDILLEAVKNDVVVGQVWYRIVNDKNELVAVLMHISVPLSSRGRGFSTLLARAGLLKAKEEYSAVKGVAYITPSNRASMFLAYSLGAKPLYQVFSLDIENFA